MPVKKIRGIQLAYDDIGKGNSIVFIHGQPFNRSMWKYQTDYFKNDHRLIIPDLRGYGESEFNCDRILLDEMALDIAYLLDELSINHAIFCGLSMGGQVILDFYRLFPHRVKALMIADSDARNESKDSYERRLLLSQTLLKDGMKKYTDENIHHYIAHKTKERNPEMYDHLYKMMTATNAQGAAAAQKGRAERRDHIPILSEIKIPVLIIVGTEDHFTPLPIAEMMSKNIPYPELICIEDAGHLPNMEMPDAFNLAIDKFLKQNSL